MLVRIANRNDPEQTASSEVIAYREDPDQTVKKQSDLGFLLCLSRPFGWQILEHVSTVYWIFVLIP